MRCGLPSSACATGSPAEKEPAAVHPLAPRPALLGVTFVTASLCQFHAEPSARRLSDGAHVLRGRASVRVRSAPIEIRESRVGVSAKWRTAFPNHFTRGQPRVVATTKHTKGTKGPSRTFGPFAQALRRRVLSFLAANLLDGRNNAQKAQRPGEFLVWPSRLARWSSGPGGLTRTISGAQNDIGQTIQRREGPSGVNLVRSWLHAYLSRVAAATFP
ncbi:MAG: hypothetical protein RJB55_2916 [Verrucomicrobiota bacterium]